MATTTMTTPHTIELTALLSCLFMIHPGCTDSALSDLLGYRIVYQAAPSVNQKISVDFLA
jgi:hypothetical protein